MNYRQKEAENNARKEMEYRRVVNNMAKCEKNLQARIKESEDSAVREEREGRHANAVNHVHTVRNLKNIRNKMLQMRSNLDMLYTMRGISVAFDTFTDICNNMMSGMDVTGNPEAIARSSSAMEKAEYEMEAMMDSINDFEIIHEENAADEESEAYLRDLMKEKQHKSTSRLATLTEKAFSGAQRDW